MAIDWLELPAPPALPALFLRAALRRRVTGRSLPELGVRCLVTVDPRHLARYRQICGFADDHRLPAPYPHILAFALQMQLLTDKRFPFPLLGLVHLENHIRVLRPLGGLGPFTVSVQVQDLQPHDKGVTFSLITQLHDQLGLLWEGDSRILCRALRLDGKPAEREAETALAQTTLAHWRAPADIGRRYARIAGDYNPIHLFAATAKLFGFPRAIAHGLWNKGRALAELGPRLPAAGYEVSVRFQKPVLLPSEVRLQASEAGDSGQFSLLGQDERVHMHGSWRPLA
jgi:acyl dehydratase